MDSERDFFRAHKEDAEREMEFRSGSAAKVEELAIASARVSPIKVSKRGSRVFESFSHCWRFSKAGRRGTGLGSSRKRFRVCCSKRPSTSLSLGCRQLFSDCAQLLWQGSPAKEDRVGFA